MKVPVHTRRATRHDVVHVVGQSGSLPGEPGDPVRRLPERPGGGVGLLSLLCQDARLRHACASQARRVLVRRLTQVRWSASAGAWTLTLLIEAIMVRSLLWADPPIVA